jgi:hypothetical protein
VPLDDLRRDILTEAHDNWMKIMVKNICVALCLNRSIAQVMEMSLLWRYEFIATGLPLADVVVLDSGSFRAVDAYGAKSVLASALRNVKPSGPARPNAIRLIDPSGQEIWRARLQAARQRLA